MRNTVGRIEWRASASALGILISKYRVIRFVGQHLSGNTVVEVSLWLMDDPFAPSPSMRKPQYCIHTLAFSSKLAIGSGLIIHYFYESDTVVLYDSKGRDMGHRAPTEKLCSDFETNWVRKPFNGIPYRTAPADNQRGWSHTVIRLVKS
jgi:hypothetical protein